MEISNETIHELQMIQSAFAFQLMVAMVITDSEGNCITKPSYSNEQNLPLEKEILKEFISLTTKLNISDRTFVLDTPNSPIRGLKCILSPISLNNNTYIFWVGPLLIKGMKETLICQLSQDQKRYEDYIKVMREISSAEIVNLIQNVEEISQIIKKTINYDYRYSQTIRQFGLIEKLFLQYNVKDFFHEAVNGFFQNFIELSFMGYAESMDLYKYQINSIFGNYNDLLFSEEFLIGEGFLGQTASTGKFTVWNNIKDDERAFKFSTAGKPLQSIFCFPFNKKEQADTIIFGGSFQKEIDSQLTSLLRIMFSMFRYFESHTQLQQKLSLSQTRLNILKDFTIALSDIKDIDRVIYLLIDTSVNFVKGHFTCVLLNQNNYILQTKMLSRGLAVEDIPVYSDYLKKKYFVKDRITPKNPAFITTSWMGTVFECPLIIEEEIIGVFCVSFTEKQVHDDFSSILASLARICCLTLKMLFREEMTTDNDEKIKILFHATENFNSLDYKMIVEAKSVLLNFLTFLQEDKNTHNLCEQALLLSAYRTEFLENQGIKKKIIEIVDGLNLIKEHRKKESISVESQIIYLVLSYSTHQNSGEIEYSEIISPTLIENFHDFLLKTNTKETIIPENEQKLSTLHPNLKVLKKEYHLSEREEEVLDLIIRGASNKEIGNKLYISEHTVKNHLTNIFRKLNVKDRAQAIAKCYSVGY